MSFEPYLFIQPTSSHNIQNFRVLSIMLPLCSSDGRATQRSQPGASLLTDVSSNPERDYPLLCRGIGARKICREKNPSHASICEAHSELSGRLGEKRFSLKHSPIKQFKLFFASGTLITESTKRQMLFQCMRVVLNLTSKIQTQNLMPELYCLEVR